MAAVYGSPKWIRAEISPWYASCCLVGTGMAPADDGDGSVTNAGGVAAARPSTTAEAAAAKANREDMVGTTL